MATGDHLLRRWAAWCDEQLDPGEPRWLTWLRRAGTGRSQAMALVWWIVFDYSFAPVAVRVCRLFGWRP